MFEPGLNWLVGQEGFYHWLISIYPGFLIVNKISPFKPGSNRCIFVNGFIGAQIHHYTGCHKHVPFEPMISERYSDKRSKADKRTKAPPARLHGEALVKNKVLLIFLFLNKEAPQYTGADGRPDHTGRIACHSVHQ